MKKYILSIALVFCAITIGNAQSRKTREIENDYRRSSLYSLLISHKEVKFNQEIEDCFLEIPIPDTYNDHDLSVKVVSVDKSVPQEKTPKKGELAKGAPDITAFLNNNQVASRLVAKWFERNMTTGEMGIDLIVERGLYAASEADKDKAQNTVRRDDILASAGEDLIQNTFVLVNDITYIDKANRAKVAGSILKVLGEVAAAYTGDDVYSNLGNTVGDVVETIKGFSVKINTSLYQLAWDEESKGEFYNCWEQVENGNKMAFENIRDKFKLKYVGSQLSSGSTTSFMGIREDQPERMIRKACQRALDENIANLQQNFQAFQIKTILDSVDPIEARVGKKEGITEKSVFEVLLPEKNADGRITYKKIGEVRPIPNLIWDNRYMAEEEMAEGATLGCTTFKKTSGEVMAGCLIRQIK